MMRRAGGRWMRPKVGLAQKRVDPSHLLGASCRREEVVSGTSEYLQARSAMAHICRLRSCFDFAGNIGLRQSTVGRLKPDKLFYESGDGDVPADGSARFQR